MSALMVAWQLISGGGRLAPAVVVERAFDALGSRPSQPGARVATQIAAHFAFGAGAGAAYAVATRALLRVAPGAQQVPEAARGAAYGLGVWAVSYGLGIPALGLLPSPALDRPGRQRRLVAAHLVYGATLGLTARARPVRATRRESWSHHSEASTTR